jgi:hypothetical protein
MGAGEGNFITSLETAWLIGPELGASTLLPQEKLRWVCEGDFWILQGGPIAHAACQMPCRGVIIGTT